MEADIRSVSKCKLCKRLNVVTGSFEQDAPLPDWEKKSNQQNHGEFQQKSNFS